MSGADANGVPAASDWTGLARSAADAFGPATSGAETDRPRELLVFDLDATAYAIPVEQVREIVRLRALTRVPRAPERLLGVIALRGEVVEVLDLRRCLGALEGSRSSEGAGAMEGSRPSEGSGGSGGADSSKGPGAPGPRSRIVVLQGEDDRVTGLLVDAVESVLRVPEQAIRAAPAADATRVVGMCRDARGFVSLLDVERLLGVDDA